MEAILGISAFYHDSAAALVVDGEVIAAVQEERFTRRKHDPSYPSCSIDYVLSEAGLTIDKVGHVVFYDLPSISFLSLGLSLNIWSYALQKYHSMDKSSYLPYSHSILQV